ncbi:MAG: thiamine pyrophosphate-dependent enzyme [Maricaulaceae bacterium]
MFNRADIIDEGFKRRVTALDLPEITPPLSHTQLGLSAKTLVDWFDTQIMSRQLDLMARRTKGETFYSIGSAGHEGLAAIATASRLTDMAFLHYRDAAFVIQRRKSVVGSTPLYDMALSFSASSEDPVSGGRHKVLGGADIYVPPQTSTIASHLPKAVGAAHSICLTSKTGLEHPLPSDSVILCSFGDASSNHSTAQGAINAACWAAYQNSPMPIVFICEDNDIGISVRTPRGWIEQNYKNRPSLGYIQCDGRNLLSVYAGATSAITTARNRRKPVFLHVKTVRLAGHAGADIEMRYTDMAAIEANESRDPLLVTAALLIENNILTADEILNRYNTMAARVERVAQTAFTRPKLSTAKDITAPITPPEIAFEDTPSLPSLIQHKALFAQDSTQVSRPSNMARQIGYALTDLMQHYKNAIVFGEDVARKGGVYSVTSGLLDKFGPARVMDTLLDEQTILGLAIGAAHNGFLPVPEIQFLAYLHNAEDQIRGEAATLSFFSNGQFTNPMVIRIAGLGYQRGFGGHFHNDNSINVLRDIPGLIIVCPSNGEDARRMLRTAFDLAHRERKVVIFLEPIALYMTTDLHEDGDKLWTSHYTPPQSETTLDFGIPHQHGAGKDVCILTYGNGYYLSRKAEKTLKEKHGLNLRVIDLRWLKPLNETAIVEATKACDHILIVDECRKTGSLAEELTKLLIDNGYDKPIRSVTGVDSYIPLGPAAYEVLPSVDNIINATLSLIGKGLIS